MSQEEADQFEQFDNFSAILQMRGWDEAAKDVTVDVEDNKKFADMIRRVLESNGNK